jgi:LysM repeat protein
MDNNDNLKPQKTGGLKLMTVFIGVLALHVIAIGGITIYHLVNGGSDADLVADQGHKGAKGSPDSATVTDGTLPDATTDKASVASTAPAETKPTTPAATPAPANESTPAESPDASSAAASPAESTEPVAGMTPPPAPVTPAPVAQTETASAPSGPTPSGPVITPESGTSPSMADSDANAEATPAPAPIGGTSYTVKSHDSLARIAHQHHLTLAQLREANDLKSDRLQIGQKLVLPSRTALASTAAPATGITPDASDTTVLSGSAPTPKKAHLGGMKHEQIALMPTSHHLYTVARGDTLTRIAHKFHTTTSALIAVNNIGDVRKMRIGQKIRIPSQESRSATAAPLAYPVAQPVDSQRIQPRATPSAQLANFMP